MLDSRTTMHHVPLQSEAHAHPDPALRRLDRLLGTWRITGRTLGSSVDDIHGSVTIEWLPGGFFLAQRSEIEMAGFSAQSLEIVGYDPATQLYPAHVYSSADGRVHRYWWDFDDDQVIHWTHGSRFTGRFSDDGAALIGSWRPDGGDPHAAVAYDATMSRTR